MRNPWELLEGASLWVELWLQDRPSKLIAVAFARVGHACAIPEARSHSDHWRVFLAVLAIEEELRPVHTLCCSHFLVRFDGDVWHTCHVSGVTSLEWHLLTFYAHERSTCVLPLIVADKLFSIRPNPHWATHQGNIAFWDILASDVSVDWMLLVILVELCMRNLISFSIRKWIIHGLLMVIFIVVIEVSVKVILLVLFIARGMVIVFAIFSDLIML